LLLTLQYPSQLSIHFRDDAAERAESAAAGSKSKDTPPAVYGEWKVPGATRSIILYAHYDGQPVDPKQWTASPPWQPTWRSAAMESGGLIVSLPATGEINSEWRIYARGASDDKAGVMGILTAFDALRGPETHAVSQSQILI
jgi:acetylornithine deacetylase/succinyl-diaminopimelate desuccinylase-like protein